MDLRPIFFLQKNTGNDERQFMTLKEVRRGPKGDIS